MVARPDSSPTAPTAPAPPDGCPHYPFTTRDSSVPALFPAGHQGKKIFQVALPEGQADSRAWWVADHAAAVQVLRDDGTFLRGTADAIAPFQRLSPFLLAFDGEHHRKLRNLTSRRFTPTQVERFRPEVEALAHRLVDGIVAAAEPADLFDTLAWPLTLNVMADYLGMPEHDRGRFRDWGDMLLSSGPDRESDNEAAITAMVEYAGELLAQRRDAPTEDVLSLAIANADRLGVAAPEAALLVVGLVVAGWETTAAAIADTVFTLLSTREADGSTLYDRLRGDPGTIGTAVEEFLRTEPINWTGAIQPRRAARDVELAGTRIAAGDVVLVAGDAAGRDPAVFTDPDHLDLHRDPNPHLAFGGGVHFCLGAHLARLELKVALEVLTTRLPTLRLAVEPGEVEWNHATTFRRPESLPVAWSAA